MVSSCFLKGQSGEILLGVNTSIMKEKILSVKFWLHSVMHTVESNFSNLVIEYLGKIETEFENILVCLSGAQTGSNHAKNGGRKSCDTLPLNI